mmetsp:Transcript_11851/g.34127  ORF Transcript_11851/g.34127 Transcript_11851/m.34127 type:complete len:409 (-) Transcript_11851:698-1924(-)
MRTTIQTLKALVRNAWRRKTTCKWGTAPRLAMQAVLQKVMQMRDDNVQVVRAARQQATQLPRQPVPHSRQPHKCIATLHDLHHDLALAQALLIDLRSPFRHLCHGRESIEVGDVLHHGKLGLRLQVALHGGQSAHQRVRQRHGGHKIVEELQVGMPMVRDLVRHYLGAADPIARLVLLLHQARSRLDRALHLHRDDALSKQLVCRADVLNDVRQMDGRHASINDVLRHRQLRLEHSGRALVADTWPEGEGTAPHQSHCALRLEQLRADLRMDVVPVQVLVLQDVREWHVGVRSDRLVDHCLDAVVLMPKLCLPSLYAAPPARKQPRGGDAPPQPTLQRRRLAATETDVDASHGGARLPLPEQPRRPLPRRLPGSIAGGHRSGAAPGQVRRGGNGVSPGPGELLGDVRV